MRQVLLVTTRGLKDRKAFRHRMCNLSKVSLPHKLLLRKERTAVQESHIRTCAVGFRAGRGGGQAPVKAPPERLFILRRARPPPHVGGARHSRALRTQSSTGQPGRRPRWAAMVGAVCGMPAHLPATQRGCQGMP